MKMKIEFELDNDAFGDGHDDPQFGYAIETALKRVGKSYAGASRRQVGEDRHDGDRVIYDSNGNTVGTVEFTGYEPPVLTRDEKVLKFFEDHNHAEIIEALAECLPDLKVPMGILNKTDALANFVTNSRTPDEDIDALVAHYD